MLIFETQILQLGLDLEESEPVGERGVDIQRLAGDLILLGRSHGAESAHVVQPVGHLDQHHPYVLAHGQKQLAEVLGLRRRLFAEYASRYLCQPRHYLGYLGPEQALDVLHRIVGVLHHVVEQGGAYRCGAEPYLLAGDLRHSYWVEYVRLARTAAYSAVGFFREAEGALYDLHFLAVVAFEIALKHVLKLVFYQAFFLFGGHIVLLVWLHG